MLRRYIVTGIVLLFLLSSLIPITSSYSSYETNKAYIIHVDENGTLSGYVKDTSMNPIEGARVRVYFHETYEENYTDSSGYYHVTNIPICYCLKNATVSKEGYTTEWVLLAIDENTTLDFVLTPLGKTLYVGGSGPGNYSRIQDAIDNASDGDTVFVYNGTYYENLIVDKSIILQGENKNNTVIDSTFIDNIIDINSEYVNIKGFTIKNCKDGYSGIRIQSDSNNIEGNIFTSNYICILFSGNSNNNTVFENLFIDNLDGISFIENSKNNLIKYCVFINNTGGICFFNGHKNSEVTFCSFKGNKHDIEVDYLTISNKIFYNNFMGNGIVRHWMFFNFNLYTNNYWYDWIGFGPYHVNGFFNWDWHPAKEPYDI